MIRYVIKRIILLIPVIVAVSLMVFVLMELAPGSPIDALIGQMTDATAEDIAALEAKFGLDKPLLVRYGRYMFRLVQGDLGVSDMSGINIWDTYITRLPNTMILAFGGIIIGSVVSVPMGIRAARKAGKLGDNITTTFTLVGMSMPSFWLALLLILLFAYILKWLPAGDIRGGVKSYILPVFCSGLTLMATSTRQTRSSMLEVLNADFLRTARAKGVPEQVVIRKHALGNAWIPTITTIGNSLGISLAGSAVIEAAFTYPGVGRMVVEAVVARDVKIATGAVIMTSIIYVFINLLVDLAYAFVDPRIKSRYISQNRRRKKTAVIFTNLPEPDMESASPGDTEVPASSAVNIAEETNETIPGALFETANIQQPEVEAAAVIKTEAEPEGYHVSMTGDEPEQAGDKTETFVTVDEQQLTAPKTSKYKDMDVHTLVIKKYRKRGTMGEIFHHLSKNKGAMAGLIILGLLIVILILSIIFIKFETVTKSNVSMRFTPPGKGALFGTDNMGRDQFLRVIFGTRYSLLIGFCGVAIATFFGVILGSIAGYFGKAAEDFIMRLADILASIPGLLLGMVIMTVLGQSIPNLIIAVGVPATHIFIRITRASILSVRGNEFVEASRAIGLSHFRVMFKHVLPNGLAPIIVTFTTTLGLMIIMSASLSFLGFGVPVPHPEWGTLIANGRTNIRNAPWLTTFPGLFIMITVLAFNLLGDGLRDALDPKLKK